MFQDLIDNARQPGCKINVFGVAARTHTPDKKNTIRKYLENTCGGRLSVKRYTCPALPVSHTTQGGRDSGRETSLLV
jgi:hypothetical protein